MLGWEVFVGKATGIEFFSVRVPFHDEEDMLIPSPGDTSERQMNFIYIRHMLISADLFPLRQSPAQYVPYDLIIWYVSKIIYLSWE